MSSKCIHNKQSTFLQEMHSILEAAFANGFEKITAFIYDDTNGKKIGKFIFTKN